MTFERLSFRSLELIRRWNQSRRLAIGTWPTFAEWERYKEIRKEEAAKKQRKAALFIIGKE